MKISLPLIVVTKPQLRNFIIILKTYIQHQNIGLSQRLTFHLNVLEEKRRLEKNKNLPSQFDDPISTEEIDKAIKKLKNKKAPGLDRIRNEMLKTS